MNFSTVSSLRKGCPAQFPAIEQNSLCSIGFHFDALVGRWVTVIVKPNSSARCWSPNFHHHPRELFAPPQSASINSCFLPVYTFWPTFTHHWRIAATANAGV